MSDSQFPTALRMGRRGVLAAGLAAFASPAFGKDDLDAFFADEMAGAGIPGLAVGLARKGTVRLARGYGFADLADRRPVTGDTMFHIASITKTVTAAAVMRLADQGRLALDAPVAPHLDFPLVNPHHRDAPVTFRHLLTHVSSISDAKYYGVDFRVSGVDANLALGDLLKDYLAPGGRIYSSEGCFSKAAPGAAWDYSNVGYGLLGYLAGRIGGQDMREQTREAIFAPLGMRHTSWTIAGTPEALRATPYDLVDGALGPVAPVGFPDWPVGMIRCSISDLMRFVAASANGGVARGTRIVSEQGMAQMLDMKTPPGLPDWLTGQGLGWMESKLGDGVKANHWGGDPGVFTAAYLDPASRSGVAILTNMTASAESKAAVKRIAARLLTA
ncbi:MAG: serine hydrolase domain-containing protein [Phenylobacterium sp.]|uniref:serine hydrolase domain-containing protein n=1 Tax=Phenylobacterium sp. TaxID=1871053 RepID=UPI00273689B1|nr:serine hydrolase domain-containing protein [Phenylobacterium sp.]MDP3747326.1 serine hydrolase domain-containing protein [Phenylobacterium sp.]